MPMPRAAAAAIAALALTAMTPACAGDDPYLYVLGIAQDAGYPQAGCYRPHCLRAWTDRDKRRLAASIALVDERERTKYLFEATPDIREQLYALHRIASDDEYRFGGVFLTHAHIGHYTGLMHFGREAMGAKSIAVFAMPRMLEYLRSNGPWSQLVDFDNIRLEALADGREVSVNDDIRVTPFLVPHRDEFSETVGYRIDGPNRSAIFLPDIDKWDRWDTDIRDVVRTVDYALVDATFFDGGELPGRDMNEIPHPFVVETMALFEALPADVRRRIIFIHLNHSNPLLIDGSDANRLVRERGFRVAFEGMRLPL